MRAAIHWLDRISAFADRIALFGAVLSVAALVFLAGWQAAARAHDLFALTADAAEGRTNPVMRDFDCRMVSMYPTQGPVMRAFVDDMLAAEGKGGLLSLSLAHGFPYGDTERTGTRMLAIAHSDAELAQGAAERFGRPFGKAARRSGSIGPIFRRRLTAPKRPRLTPSFWPIQATTRAAERHLTAPS